MLTEEEAKRVFARFLVNECPECKTPVGVLCDDGAVWIHLDRMKLIPDFVP